MATNDGMAQCFEPKPYYNAAHPTLYFYSSKPSKEPTTFMYTQFHKAPIYDKDTGLTYNSNEQWYQHTRAVIATHTGAQKIANPKRKDTNVAETPQAIMDVTGCVEQSKLGRDLKLCSEEERKWEENKASRLFKVNWLKFSQNPDEREWLLSTGDRELVEASEDDAICGIGFDYSKAEANRSRWGKNLLGHALMQVRKRLRRILKQNDNFFADVDAKASHRLKKEKRLLFAGSHYMNNPANKSASALPLGDGPNIVNTLQASANGTNMVNKGGESQTTSPQTPPGFVRASSATAKTNTSAGTKEKKKSHEEVTAQTQVAKFEQVLTSKLEKFLDKPASLPSAAASKQKDMITPTPVGSSASTSWPENPLGYQNHSPTNSIQSTMALDTQTSSPPVSNTDNALTRKASQMLHAKPISDAEAPMPEGLAAEEDVEKTNLTVHTAAEHEGRREGQDWTREIRVLQDFLKRKGHSFEPFVLRDLGFRNYDEGLDPNEIRIVQESWKRQGSKTQGHELGCP